MKLKINDLVKVVKNKEKIREFNVGHIPYLVNSIGFIKEVKIHNGENLYRLFLISPKFIKHYGLYSYYFLKKLN